MRPVEECDVQQSWDFISEYYMETSGFIARAPSMRPFPFPPAPALSSTVEKVSPDNLFRSPNGGELVKVSCIDESGLRIMPVRWGWGHERVWEMQSHRVRIFRSRSHYFLGCEFNAVLSKRRLTKATMRYASQAPGNVRDVAGTLASPIFVEEGVVEL